jgi:hypothetical protein
MKTRISSRRILFWIILCIPFTNIAKAISLPSLFKATSRGEGVLILEDFDQGTLSGWGNIADWELSDEQAISGNYSLKHATGSGFSYIYHPLLIPDLDSDSLTWRLTIKNGNWDPSSSNKFWFFLVSDRYNLSEGANGYAVGVNFSGSDDLLKLYRVTGGSVSSVVISSSIDWDPNTLAGIEINRLPGGHWNMKTDDGSGFNSLMMRGSGTDNTYLSSEACGLVFAYTSTRAGSLWMDDLYIGPPIPDKNPPILTTATVFTPNLISLNFSEPVNPASALNLSNYTIDGTFHPSTIEIPEENPSQVLLHFQDSLREDEVFTLWVSGVSDMADNVMEPASIQLMFESLKLLSVRVLGANKLRVSFNKEISPSTAEYLMNYLLNPGETHPISATRNPVSENEVFLEFENLFQEKQPYTLLVNSIRDLQGNIIKPSQSEFIVYFPKPYDIVINEIMAKPAPSFGLPGEEYIELHNLTPYQIDLTGWTLQISSSSRTIPEVFIEGGDYLILCHTSVASGFSTYGPTVGINSFPAIPDPGQIISLWDKDEVLISAVNYTDKWYNSSFKAGGGWSLEQIDPMNPCGGKLNWTASEHPEGGTPGKSNSVKALHADNSPPLMHRAVPIAPNALRVFFTEPYQHVPAISADIFTVDNNVGSPFQIQYASPLFFSMDLFFTEDFSFGVSYTLSVSNDLRDCAGNRISENNSVRFSLPAQAMKHDLIINEILFNSFDGGVNFVEIYNRSDKVLDLKDVFLSSRDLVTGELKSIYRASNEGFLIFPREYLVITTESDLVLRYYYSPNPLGFSEIPVIPPMNNDKGTVILLNKSMDVLDEITYNEQMHYPLLSGTKGVSLERISAERPSEDPTNWHSASQAVGFATPAYRNSQFSDAPLGDASTFRAEPEVFSPDNDGIDDQVHVSYSLDKPGFIASVTLFDSRGRIVRNLLKGQMLGTEGVFSWDGRTDSGQMAPLGIYLIFIDLYHADGTTRQHKITSVLAGKLH